MKRSQRIFCVYSFLILLPYSGCAQFPPLPIIPVLSHSEQMNVYPQFASSSGSDIQAVGGVQDEDLPSIGVVTPVASEKNAESGAKKLPQKAMELKAPHEITIELKAPQLEATDFGLPINLTAALRLADARPLIISAAQASAWAAEARLARAKVLWMPTLNIGFSYTRHDGLGPDINGGENTPTFSLNENVNFFYGGIGLTQYINLTDAIYEPLAARQVLKSAQWDIQTARNDALLQTALAYFNVHESRGKYAGALNVVERGRSLINRILKQTGDLVPKVEVDRAINAVADLEQKAVSAREEWRVQSANLTQVLRLDPRAVVVPIEEDHLQITLVDPARPLDELVPIGLTSRPELASQQALVQAVLVRIRQEKMRPVLPSILLNGAQTPGMLYQAGFTGMGGGNSLNNWSPRDDISIQFIWQLEGLGFGNLARIKKRRAEQSQTLVDLFRVQDAVAQEVTESQAKLQSAAVRVLEADRSLREAIITYDGSYEGLTQTTREKNVLVPVYRPWEAVTALEHLQMAFDHYFMTVADYNRAQFHMFHALGYPAGAIERLRPPGDLMPVDTTRPGYMPEVLPGPPPATR